MKITHIALSEVAGMPYRLCRALREAGHEATHIGFGRSFFPCDEERPTWERLRRAIDEADVVHLHGTTTWGLLQREIAGRPALVHIHGAPDRGSGVKPPLPCVVATPDLAAEYPDARFIPNLVLPADLPPSAPLGSGPVRFFKSPSMHDKHQRIFGRVVEALAGRLRGRVAYVAPPFATHDALARLRATCHVSLDHLHGYYGLESLESLAQGLVAVNGATEACLDAVAEVVGARPPFAVARDAAEAGQLILSLVEEALTRPADFEARREAGRRFVADHYRPERIVALWEALYEELRDGARPRARAAAAPRPAATPYAEVAP